MCAVIIRDQVWEQVAQLSQLNFSKIRAMGGKNIPP
jgi:hypothetical protein